MDIRESAGTPVRLKDPKDAALASEELVHVYRGGKVVCETDKRGHPTRQGFSPIEIVVDASEGFIPLWAPDVTLRWRFQERSMTLFQDPEQGKAYLRALLGEALLLWTTSAVPVKFKEASDAWDFEIALNPTAHCIPTGGCTLARAFFPDAGQHDLLIYPTMFDQPTDEQIETMAHELGHVFGLRHFFAQVSEQRWRSEIFGGHQPFSIMNYGSDSRMSAPDRDDLRRLYELVWKGELTSINETPIRSFTPFSTARLPSTLAAVGRGPATTVVLAS